MKIGVADPKDQDRDFSPLTRSKGFGVRVATNMNEGEGSKLGILSPKGAKLPALPNRKLAMHAGDNIERVTPTLANEQDEQAIIIEGFSANAAINDVNESKQHEVYCYLMLKNCTLKKHLLILIGNEIYFFRSRSDTSHKKMHCLTGTYIQEDDDSEIRSCSDKKSSPSQLSK